MQNIKILVKVVSKHYVASSRIYHVVTNSAIIRIILKCIANLCSYLQRSKFIRKCVANFYSWKSENVKFTKLHLRKICFEAHFEQLC